MKKGSYWRRPLMKVAFFCTQAATSRRPLMLSKKTRLNEKQLTAPGFFLDSGESSRNKSSYYGSLTYQFSSTHVPGNPKVKPNQVAVKTLSAGSRLGVRDFFTEINTVSHVKHPNLVELIGCCVEGPSRVLVYEYEENNSLDRALLGTWISIIRLDWRKRASICMGTTKGLAFLQEELVPHIVHRDIKASNILLHRDFNPKIGDFGLAKLFPDNITHISARIAGTTYWLLAPEYAMGGQLTMKADVYSFGFLIREVVGGKSSARANWGGS
ncbi:hypothetical protein TanjilG_27743 [Lupinus angustifolius]|uniref:non-specific serine/threonine protein kinase n=1 Tax=Lupinus angustifolius TaxID=3871 RepID=A0A4P1RH54_LUPAN|nr:hypothetical protein TanjilG_27743 [Lupinus angustifolius]